MHQKGEEEHTASSGSGSKKEAGKRFIPSIAVDFDGVLSLYNGDSSQPPGPPVPQAREFVEKLRRRGMEVVVFSSRDRETIARWLVENEFPPLEIFYKPPVVAIIDDRAVRFCGEFEGLSRAIWERPWWQGRQKRSQTNRAMGKKGQEGC